MNGKIIGYRIVQCVSWGQLEECVSDFISNNWEPMGAPFIDGHHFFQAMVIREPNDPLISEKI